MIGAVYDKGRRIAVDLVIHIGQGGGSVIADRLPWPACLLTRTGRCGMHRSMAYFYCI